MKKLPSTPSRKEVFEFIFQSSRYGNLGLFVGAGFSKAIFADEEENTALSWRELLARSAEKMKVDFSSLATTGVSYPELASAVCRAHADANDRSFDESLAVLKQKICNETAWYPSEPQRTAFGGYLRKLRPAWIVTTNYDQVLECLLPGKSASLGPNDTFTSQRSYIPIFHLHGVRTEPAELIIAQEDYVSLFRPNEYRQIRLALAMKESTTCFLGYSLGDVNVLTALDWSTHVFAERTGDYPHDVIQVLRASEPREDPYRSSNGICIIETEEISSFFNEFIEATADARTRRRQRNRALNNLALIFAKAAPEDISRFIEDQDWRTRILKMLKLFRLDVVAEFENFLGKSLKEVSHRSGQPGAFKQYAINLNILIDLLTAFAWHEFPPALVPVAAHSLDRLVPSIGLGFGESWEAQRVWDARKQGLTAETIAGLLVVAEQYNYAFLRKFLREH